MCIAGDCPVNPGGGFADFGGTFQLCHNAAPEGNAVTFDSAAALDGQAVQLQVVAALGNQALIIVTGIGCKNENVGQGDGVAVALNAVAVGFAHGAVPGQAGEAGVGQVDVNG